MAKDNFRYTLLKQDGTREDLGVWPEKAFKTEFVKALDDFNKGLYEILDCTTIQLIPRDYWPAEFAQAEAIWGDDEGRFNTENIRNPHMKVLYDANGHAWDCVGDIVVQEAAK